MLKPTINNLGGVPAGPFHYCWIPERNAGWIFDAHTGAGVIEIQGNHDNHWRDEYDEEAYIEGLAERILEALNGTKGTQP